MWVWETWWERAERLLQRSPLPLLLCILHCEPRRAIAGGIAVIHLQ